MFTTLAPLATKNPLSLTISVDEDGVMTVVLLPRGDGAMSTPLALTATPAELDEGFADVVNKFVATRSSLAEQLAAAEAMMQSAANDVTVKAAKKAVAGSSKAATVRANPVTDEDPDNDSDDDELPSSPTSKPVSVSDDPLASLFGDQK